MSAKQEETRLRRLALLAEKSAKGERLHMTATSPAFRIEPATERDVPLILRLIKALSEYERLAHEVTATEEQLRRTLFGPHPSAEVIIGYAGDEPAGFALFFPQLLDVPRQAGHPPRGSVRGARVARPRLRRAAAARIWRRSRSSATAGGSNGACSTGTSRRSASTRSLGATADGRVVDVPSHRRRAARARRATRQSEICNLKSAI